MPATDDRSHDFTAGVYQRRVTVGATEHRAWATLDDDYHGFRVTLTIADGLVADVAASASRVPWTTCPGAILGLQTLKGRPVAGIAGELAALDRGRFCVHLADLARFAARQSLEGGERTYAVDVGVDAERGPCALRLTVDGVLVVAAGFDRGDPSFESPAAMLEFSMKGLTTGETQEMAVILRRAVHVAAGRQVDFGALSSAAELGLDATCHSLQPERSRFARPTVTLKPAKQGVGRR